jgi:hypothetical protein
LPPNQPTISFRLPEAKDVDVFLVRLADGRLVARTREELAALPPALRDKLQMVQPPAPPASRR